MMDAAQSIQRAISFMPFLTTAIRENRKTKTRRTGGLERVNESPDDWFVDGFTQQNDCIEFRNKITRERLIVHYKQMPGSFMYIRETHYVLGKWIVNGTTKAGKPKYRFVRVNPETNKVHFDDPTKNGSEVLKSTNKNKSSGAVGLYKRNARFMPKDYARTWVKVVDISVQRLLRISPSDAIAEGVERSKLQRSYWILYTGIKGATNNPVWSFLSLWDFIHGHDAHKADPWCFVIKFEQCYKPSKTI